MYYKGRDEILKKDGGLGLCIRKESCIEVECIHVNENEMHEDVLIAECNINVGQNKE